MTNIFRLSLMSLLIAQGVQAEIWAEGTTLTFVSGEVDPNTPHFEKITRFHQEMEIDPVDVEGSVPGIFPLLAKLKRRVVQGIRFQVSRSRDYAVVLSYYCSIQEPGAEMPFECQSASLALDAEGRVLSRTEGNHFLVEVHDFLPFFILKEDSCCDSPVRSTVYRMTGEKVCEIADHRDESWVSRNTIRCRRNPDGRRVRIDLVEE